MSNPSKRQLTFVDCFAGCGGLSLGLMQAGLAGQFAIEHDKFAFATLKANLLQPKGQYRFNWPDWLAKKPTAIGDFLRTHAEELEGLRGSIDVLVGGPPCQGFSSAGRREHDDPRNKLFQSYLKLVDSLEPKVVVIENVRGFTVDFDVEERVKNYSARLKRRLSGKYEVFEELLDLAEFGVPQSRTRYFLIAFRRDAGTFANPFKALKDRLPSYLRSLQLKAPVSCSQAISDFEVARNGIQPSRETPGFQEIKYQRPLTRYQKFMAEGVEKPKNLRLARHAPDIVERFEEIIEHSHAEGRLLKSIGDDLRQKFGLKKRALRVLDPDRPAPTITSMPDDLLHYSEPRTLTLRESARLQSFPDWFTFHGKYTTGGDMRRKEVPRFTQVANAVPPLVARAIGEMLAGVLSAKKPSNVVQLTVPAQRRKQASKLVA